MFLFFKHILQSTLTFGDGGLAGGIRRFLKIFSSLPFPFRNGKHIETIDMVSPINPRFPATINSPKNVMKNDDFSRAPKSFFLIRQFPFLSFKGPD